MSIDYETLVSNLIESLPFIISVVVIERKDEIVYSTRNWDIKSEILSIISTWLSLKHQPVIVSENQYTIRQCTNDRLIATSLEGKGHIIGVKDDNRIILAHIEKDGVIPFATMEMARTLALLIPKKPYLDEKIRSETVFKKKTESLTVVESNKIENIKPKVEDNTTRVSFTARLMAYYRAQEKNRLIPLIIDPFAENLAGDLRSYFKDHIRYSEMDYPIVRSYYIEKQLLTPWCNTNKASQIVLLGAGLDTRAYRFLPLKTNHHTIFELDFLEIISYKQQILAKEKSLCSIKRISADLSDSNWTSQLIKSGYSREIPTFWILEGLVYYLELETVISLLKVLKNLSNTQSQIFIDIVQRSRWLESSEPLFADSMDAFTKHFKWGLDIKQVPQFFMVLGWNVSCSFADDHDQGRNVGQKAMIFVHGYTD